MKKAGLGVVITVIGLGLVFGGQLFSQSDKILAKVGDRLIKQREMDELIRKYVQMKPKKGEALTMEEKKGLLDRMVKGVLMAREAEKEKLDQDPIFKEKLMAFRDELLIQEYVKKKISPAVTVTDAEVEQKLKDNPQLVPKESLRMREILVKTEKEANEVHEELLKGGDFSQIAVKKSIGPTAENGGHLKMPVARGMLPKEVEEVVFKLKKGEFTRPFKTDKGYMLLSLVDRKDRTPEEIKRLEGMVKEKIKEIESGRKLEAAIEKRAEELKKGVKIEVHYDQIK